LGGLKSTRLNPISFAELMEENGAGEIIINSIYHDGMMTGYDIPLIKEISQAVSIPVVATGGAGSLNDFAKVIYNTNVSAVAAGSMFVYHGARRGVLINYPTNKELLKLFEI